LTVADFKQISVGVIFGKDSRDPILPAKPSASVQRKKRSHQTMDGLPVHSFESLLKDLASRAGVTYALKSEKSEEKTNLFRMSPAIRRQTQQRRGSHL
jgi:hypothetical protein